MRGETTSERAAREIMTFIAIVLVVSGVGTGIGIALVELL